MALTDENGGIPATMLVGPTGYGMGGNQNGFGGDGWWVLLLLLAMGGWGNGFGGDRRQTSRRCVAGDGRTNGSATAHEQAAVQRNNPQNSRLTKAKGESEKSGSFFFKNIL